MGCRVLGQSENKKSFFRVPKLPSFDCDRFVASPFSQRSRWRSSLDSRGRLRYLVRGGGISEAKERDHQQQIASVDRRSISLYLLLLLLLFFFITVVNATVSARPSSSRSQQQLQEQQQEVTARNNHNKNQLSSNGSPPPPRHRRRRGRRSRFPPGFCLPSSRRLRYRTGERHWGLRSDWNREKRTT